MPELKHGTVTITYNAEFTLPAKAGKLNPTEVKQLSRARRGIGVAGADTADAMTKHPTRLNVPGVNAEELLAATNAADAIDRVIYDIEGALVIAKQANLLLDYEAHEKLRRVLAFVRSQEKFDPRLSDLVPGLTRYFANEKSVSPSPEEQAEATVA